MFQIDDNHRDEGKDEVWDDVIGMGCDCNERKIEVWDMGWVAMKYRTNERMKFGTVEIGMGWVAMTRRRVVHTRRGIAA